MKIIAISSGGGHQAELNEIINKLNLAQKYNLIIASEDFKKANYHLPSSKRDKKIKFLISFAYLIVKSVYIYIKERPEKLITTGANTAFPLIYIMNKFNHQIIFIESIARVNSKSKTGKLIESYPNVQIYVQWKEMLKVYPNAKYIGRVL